MNFYSNCDPDNPEAMLHREQRRAEYSSWRTSYDLYQADPTAERDWDEYGARISATTGVAASVASTRLMTFAILEKLPLLRAHAESMMHLSMFLLGVIAEQMFHICPSIVNKPATWEFIDTHLTAYLTPRKPQQTLPTRKAIVQKIRRILAELQERIPGSARDEEKKRTLGYYEQLPAMEGTVDVIVNLEKEKAEAIDKAVRTLAKQRGCTLAEALTSLILEDVSVSVAMNVYQAQDIPSAPIFFADGSVVQDPSWLIGHITCTRDMKSVEVTCETQYCPSKPLRAFLEGRDGTCRFPGCERPAVMTDKDHCINYADGGPTSAKNMICLCRHHHNVKTDQSIRYFLDPVTADIYWLFQDGTWVVDEATGPLAPVEKRWLQTLEQRWNAQYRKTWEE